MKYRDEYRAAEPAHRFVEAIARITTRTWTLMEICGGQTHAIIRHGIDRLLPPQLTLIHGPGCPVCVTPVEYIDKAIALAQQPNIVLCTFGDMLRVPGSHSDLLKAKSRGADVRAIYSPMDALAIARAEPDRDVVLFAVGFETTAPANAMAVFQAKRENLRNFFMLACHVLVPPAMGAILDGTNHVDGFLAAGHVCTVMGFEAYEPIAERYRVPIVVTGFEPLDILEGVFLCVQQLENGRAQVENQYSRAVARTGNRAAQQIMQEVFCVRERHWRGIGSIPESGLGLSSTYADFDTEVRFGSVAPPTENCGECVSGLVLKGERKPPDCPAFGKRCTPEHPLGVTMVSSEGACAAYYRYRGIAASTE